MPAQRMADSINATPLVLIPLPRGAPSGLRVAIRETGYELEELRTLAGHSNIVTGVALTADGRRAVSASWDNTRKGWNLESGTEVRTRAGAGPGVRGGAVVGGGAAAGPAARARP